MTTPLSKPLSIQKTPMIPVLIPSESVQLAQQLAQGHPKPDKIEQTYHNLLAVLAVNHYLKILGFQTDLSQCDCWNPFLRMTTNVADLEVVGYGRFECCPVVAADVGEGLAEVPEHCVVPADVQEERVGYIAVKVNGNIPQGDRPQEQPTVHLLGFTDQINGEEWVLGERRSLFNLPQYLEELGHKSENQLSHLTNWLKSQVDEGWQTLDSLISFQRRAGYQVRTPNVLRSSEGNRSRCMYGKTLRLHTEDREETILLITEVIENPTDELSIELKICPVAPDDSHTDETAFLPPGLEMVVVDVAGDAVMQAQARAGNRMMELGFHAEEGDRFQLQIHLKDTILVESFLV
ncbi:MAG: DUF1822 family protein [Cyanobacteria bacterium P01_F01_bin.150]